MAEDIQAVENVVTRVARNDKGQYILNDGRVLDVYDPSLKGQYQKETFITYKTYTMNGVMDVDDPTQLRQMTLGQLIMALCLQRATTVEGKIISLMEDIAKNTAQINALSLLESKLAPLVDGINYVNENIYADEDEMLSIGKPAKGMAMTDDDVELFKKYSEQGFNDGEVTYFGTWLNNVLRPTPPIDVKNSTSPYLVLYVEPTEAQRAATIINEKLDSLNSLSQELLIELQSLTTKRDQAYDMVSGILKSLNTTLSGNAHNI